MQNSYCSVGYSPYNSPTNYNSLYNYHGNPFSGSPIIRKGFVEPPPPEMREFHDIPYEESFMDFIPVEKKVTHFETVEEVVSYVPVVTYEPRTEWVPIQTWEEVVHYEPVKNTYMHQNPRKIITDHLGQSIAFNNSFPGEPPIPLQGFNNGNQLNQSGNYSGYGFNGNNNSTNNRPNIPNNSNLNKSLKPNINPQGNNNLNTSTGIKSNNVTGRSRLGNTKPLNLPQNQNVQPQNPVKNPNNLLTSQNNQNQNKPPQNNNNNLGNSIFNPTNTFYPNPRFNAPPHPHGPFMSQLVQPHPGLFNSQAGFQPNNNLGKQNMQNAQNGLKRDLFHTLQ